MELDLGADACLAHRHALEHELVMRQLIAADDDASAWATAVTDHDVLNLSLDDLRGRMVTPNALSLRNVSIQQLAKSHTLPALVHWGLTWRHLLALGFTRKDLGSLDGALLRALHVTANQLLELRPSVRDIAALRLTAADMKAMGCGKPQWMSTVGYDAQSMRAHGNLSLQDWADVIGPDAKWPALGFNDFDACVNMGWDADQLYSIVFARAQARPRARPRAAAAAPAPAGALGRLNLLEIGALSPPCRR
jgi:hypothetical protein